MRTCEICACFATTQDPADVAKLRAARSSYHANINAKPFLTFDDACSDPKHMEHCGYIEGFLREAEFFEAFFGVPIDDPGADTPIFGPIGNSEWARLWSKLTPEQRYEGYMLHELCGELFLYETNDGAVRVLRPEAALTSAVVELSRANRKLLEAACRSAAEAPKERPCTCPPRRADPNCPYYKDGEDVPTPIIAPASPHAAAPPSS